MRSSCFRKPPLSSSALVCASIDFLLGCFCAFGAESTVGTAGTTTAEADWSVRLAGGGRGGDMLGSAFAFADFLSSIWTCNSINCFLIHM